MDEFEIQECIVSVIPSPKDSYDLPLESHVLGHQSFFFYIRIYGLLQPES
jgi:hypothetical protein